MGHGPFFRQALRKEIEVDLHASAALGREAENLHARLNRFNALAGCFLIEFDRYGEIVFRNHRDVGAIENCRIFLGFVLFFGH